jgi:hypothetical protein
MLWTARTQHWCVLCYFGLEELKKEGKFEHLDNESKITEKKILVSTRTPEDITIKYLTCTRRISKKKKSYYVGC